VPQQSAAQKGPHQAAQQGARHPSAAQKGVQQSAPQTVPHGLAQQNTTKSKGSEAAGARPVISPQAQHPMQGGPQASPTHDAPAFAAQRRQFASSAGQSSASAQLKPIAVNAATNVVPHTNRSGYTVDRKNSDGSRLVMSQTVRPDGKARVIAYKQIEDRRSSATTRIYLDGHRVTVAPTFVSRSIYRGPSYVTYNNGLRAAYLPGGKPIYREKLSLVTVPGGYTRQVVRRTIFTTVVHGRVVQLRSPLIQVYDVVPVYRVPVYVYRPSLYRSIFYTPFYTALAVPVIFGAACLICPTPVAVFAQPMQTYTDPIDLMADLQISSALSDASLNTPYMAPAAPSQRQYSDADVEDLRKQLYDLRQQVAANANSNPELSAALPEIRVQNASFNVQDGAAGDRATSSGDTPVQIPEYARLQVRKQVRLNIAQHQNQRAVLLSRIIEGGYAKIYIFQVSTPIDVFDVSSGEQCALSGGALLGFSQVPREATEMAQMKIIAARSNDCRTDQIVEVSLVDLQDMLNAFMQRLENNMKDLNECSSSPNACVRS